MNHNQCRKMIGKVRVPNKTLRNKKWFISTVVFNLFQVADA